ncbi:CAP domain-containing protein [Halolamina salina]|uniref:CAP domain-containing protein n=1 Tax=Halolamina salina TaxID=1220023 RepID=A0ABD6B5P3_9EURY
MRVLVVAVCVVVLLAGCGGAGTVPDAIDGTEHTTADTESTPRQPTTPSSERYDVDVEQIEELIHKKMNERRVQNGVEPLERNETLDAVARYKSWDMAQQDYFAHTGPNGTTHAEVRSQYKLKCNHSGQNIYKHTTRQIVDDTYDFLNNERKVSTGAVDFLLDSPSHRQNALSSNYDTQGIGVFVDENGTVFVTQELCG